MTILFDQALHSIARSAKSARAASLSRKGGRMGIHCSALISIGNASTEYGNSTAPVSHELMDHGSVLVIPVHIHGSGKGK